MSKNPAQRDDARWLSFYKELLDYKSQHNHANVPIRYEANPKLGKWTDRQRTHYKTGRLPPDRVELLEEAGFVFSVKENWNDKFQALKEYKETHGHLEIPLLKENGERDPLARWANDQKFWYHSGKLSKDRVQLLEDIGLSWGKKRGPRGAKTLAEANATIRSLRNEMKDMLLELNRREGMIEDFSKRLVEKNSLVEKLRREIEELRGKGETNSA